jgi:Zn-dependent peptidase ImmA (M78 family)
MSTEPYDPFAHASELGIEVRFAPLTTQHACWYIDRNLILIRSGMRDRFTRCALAHEIGHAIHRHRDDRAAHEAVADTTGATLLLRPQQVRHVAPLSSSHRDLADRLDVTVRMARAALVAYNIVPDYQAAAYARAA